MHRSSRGGEIERLGDVLERVVASLKARRTAAAEHLRSERETVPADPSGRPLGSGSPATASVLEGELVAVGH